MEELERSPELELPFDDTRFCILGAGGVARAIIVGLKRKGAIVKICARDPEKAEALADETTCRVLSWEERQNHECDVLINCTPVGMHPDLNTTPFDEQWHDRNVVVFDTVYNPERTLFIKHAREAGCKTVTGIDMFVRQASEQFELFTGTRADDEIIRYEVKRATSAANY